MAVEMFGEPWGKANPGHAVLQQNNLKAHDPFPHLCPGVLKKAPSAG